MEKCGDKKCRFYSEADDDNCGLGSPGELQKCFKPLKEKEAISSGPFSAWLEGPSVKWTSVEEELPAISQKVILFGNGVVQTEIYTMDAADVSDYAPLEYFWIRDGLEEGIAVKKGQYWMALPGPPKAD